MPLLVLPAVVLELELQAALGPAAPLRRPTRIRTRAVLHLLLAEGKLVGEAAKLRRLRLPRAERRRLARRLLLRQQAHLLQLTSLALALPNLLPVHLRTKGSANRKASLPQLRGKALLEVGKLQQLPQQAENLQLLGKLAKLAKRSASTTTVAAAAAAVVAAPRAATMKRAALQRPRPLPLSEERRQLQSQAPRAAARCLLRLLQRLRSGRQTPLGVWRSMRTPALLPAPIQMPRAAAVLARRPAPAPALARGLIRTTRQPSERPPRLSHAACAASC